MEKQIDYLYNWSPLAIKRRKELARRNHKKRSVEQKNRNALMAVRYKLEMDRAKR